MGQCNYCAREKIVDEKFVGLKPFLRRLCVQHTGRSLKQKQQSPRTDHELVLRTIQSPFQSSYRALPASDLPRFPLKSQQQQKTPKFHTTVTG